MIHPKNLSIEDYSYELPEDRIASYPLPERDASKLLIYKKGSIREDRYYNIASHLPANSLLLFNDSKVVEARLLFQKTSGGVIEIFCLQPHSQYTDIMDAMRQQEKVLWHCLIGGASKWKAGQVLQKSFFALDKKEYILTAKYVEKHPDDFLVELSWNMPGLSFAEVLHHAGAIPLPPYIKREPDASDSIRYQTIFANAPGSVAAPTAGLHFTDRVFENMSERFIKKEFITLHVGAGTFKPVKVERMGDHEMHAEYFSIHRKTIENILDNLDSSVIAVGTTSLRMIESLYWLGQTIDKHSDTELPHIGQWVPYETNAHVPAERSLEKILVWMEKRDHSTLTAKTSILVAPGYRPGIVKGLITNFHQPRSSLLLLIAAMIGDDWRKVYSHALANGFRFLSYGDGSLLWL